MLAVGHWGEPVKLPEIINDTTFPDSIGHEYHAHLSPDGTELYFTRDDFWHEDDIYVACYNKESDTWDSVTRLSVNKDDVRRELSPSITADHSRLYWCSWNSSLGYGGYDVWFAEWDSVKNDWGEPQNAGPNVNTPGYEFTCFIAPDGKTLYVSSDYDSDVDDIYKHTLQPDSTWGPRERVFENLHPFGAQYDPWVSADGKWLYFSQWWIVAHGRSISRARWQGEYFGEPEWLGPPVCLIGYWQFNDGPSLNPEGSRLYFSSNRPDSTKQASYMWYSEYLDYLEEDSSAENLFNLQISTPLKNNVVIAYALTKSSQVFCGIFDTAGNLIKIFTSGQQSGGEHRIVWNKLDERGRKVPAGTYFIQLTVNRQKVTRKTIILN